MIPQPQKESIVGIFHQFEGLDFEGNLYSTHVTNRMNFFFCVAKWMSLYDINLLESIQHDRLIYTNRQDHCSQRCRSVCDLSIYSFIGSDFVKLYLNVRSNYIEDRKFKLNLTRIEIPCASFSFRYNLTGTESDM